MCSFVRCLALVLLAAGLAGCASNSQDAYFRDTTSAANVYVAPVATPIAKVAIMPFKAPTELIGTSVSDLFVTEMLRAGRYELVERSQMSRVLGEAELALAGLSASRAAEIGNMLGADGVIIGTVDEYATIALRGKTLPVVGITARLIDCNSGKVMWSVDLAKRSDEPEKTLPSLARDVVHEMTAGLYQRWGVQRKITQAGADMPNLDQPVPVDRRAPPEPPSDLKASDMGLREVTVNWGKAAGSDRVRVERALSSNGKFAPLATVDAADGVFVDRGAKNDPLRDATTYYYRLVAIGSDGQESRPTAPMESMTAPPPAPPDEIKAQPHGSRAVQITWSPPSDEGIARYVVERAAGEAPGVFVPVGVVQGTVFHEGETATSPLRDDAAYLYRVAAVNRVGATGTFSAAVSVTTEPPPVAVAGLTAQSLQVRCVPLSWQPSAEQDVVEYEVWRADAAEGPFTRVNRVKGRSSCCYLDGGADPGMLEDARTYFYRVIAVDAVTARSADGTTVSATTRPVPPKVQLLQATQGRPREVPLKWDLSPDEKVIGYVVERAESANGPFQQVADLPRRDQVTWTDRGGEKRAGRIGLLRDGTLYQYRVTAYNTARARSPASDLVAATTKPVPATPVIAGVSTSDARRVIVAWPANPEPDIASYRIEWAREANGRYREAGTVDGSTVSFTHTDQPDGEPRCYRLRAVDQDTLESAWSVPFCGGTKPRPPPPTGVSVVWQDGAADVSWTAPEVPDVKAYRVARAGFLGLGGTVLGEAESTSLRLTAAQVGKGVTVFVTAVDADGLESERSVPKEIRPPGI